MKPQKKKGRKTHGFPTAHDWADPKKFGAATEKWNARRAGGAGFAEMERETKGKSSGKKVGRKSGRS
jgi:hypothetical protein